MRGEFTGRAFIPLYPEPEAGEALAVLNAHLTSSPPGPVVCLKPPVTGMAFITTVGEVSRMLDEWWETSVPEGALPVLLMRHEPGLEDWVPVLDAEVVVGVPREEDLRLYARATNARALVANDAQRITAHAMRCHPEWFEVAGGAPVEIPGADPHRISVRMGGVLTTGGHREMSPPGEPGDVPAEADDPWPRGAAFSSRPFEGIHDDREWAGRRRLLRSLVGPASVGSAGRSSVPRELTDLALAHHTGRIVGVSSRAGGTRRTAIAAALGVVYGEAVRESGWYAALIEQTGEADQWQRLGLTGPARTVSEIMADAEAGRRWPIVPWDRSPGLVLYPERPGAEGGYAPDRIERLAARLRQLHCLSVVDLPGQVPDFTSAEAAQCAGWAAVSDLLLLPASDDPDGLEEVLDYLDAPLVAGDERSGTRPIPVVVVRLRSSRYEGREPAALDVIRERAAAVVEIPAGDPPPAVAAGLVAVEPTLRQAYVELALAVARTLLDG